MVDKGTHTCALEDFLSLLNLGEENALAADCLIVLEHFQQQTFTVGRAGEIMTYVRMFGHWVNVTANTKIDAKHRLPPRTGARVQRHEDNDAGADQWQAWYPGAAPSCWDSRRCAGSNAREEVLKWCWDRHVEYQQASSLESEADHTSEEEDGDEAALAPDCAIVLEQFQRQVFTVGPAGEIITYVRMVGRWVNVTANTSIDVKHRLPPRTGAKVQRHTDNDAGADQWQAWYPGAAPSSTQSAGSNAREEVLKWCWDRHMEYQQASYECVD